MKALHHYTILKKTLEWREIADAEIVQQTDAILKPLAVSACDLKPRNPTLRHDTLDLLHLGKSFHQEVDEDANFRWHLTPMRMHGPKRRGARHRLILGEHRSQQFLT